MSVRNFVIIVVGLISFAILDKVITVMITGTDTGSQLLQQLLRLVVAAIIIIGAVMGIGRTGAR